MRVNQQSTWNYLNLYQKHPKRVLGHRLAGYAWPYRNDTVFTTWEISYSTIKEQSPDAAFLLHHCGFLAREFIDHDVLELLSADPSSGIPGGLKEDQVEYAVSLLLSYSFLRRNRHGRMSMHPLIHLWARERLSELEKERLARSVLESFYRAYVANRDPPLQAHIDAIAAFYQTRRPCVSDLSDSTIIKVGNSINNLGTSRALKAIDQIYGYYLLVTGKVEEWLTIMYRHLLGSAVSGLADWELFYALRHFSYNKASLLSWVACRALSTPLPIKHLRVLTILGDYAFALWNDAEKASALKLYMWLYDARKQVYGKNHPATTGALLGIGLCLSSCEQSFDYLRTAAEMRERIHGLEDTFTQNAYQQLQDRLNYCAEFEAHENWIVEWNLKTLRAHVTADEPAVKALELLRIAPEMVQRMLFYALEKYPDMARLMLETFASENLLLFNEPDGLETTSRAVDLIFRWYSTLYPSQASRKRLISILESRWRELQLALEGAWESDPTGVHTMNLGRSFSTCMHTSLGLLFALVYGSNGNISQAWDWIATISRGAATAPTGKTWYFAECGGRPSGDDPQDWTTSVSASHLEGDLEILLEYIHSFRSGSPPADWQVEMTSVLLEGAHFWQDKYDDFFVWHSQARFCDQDWSEILQRMFRLWVDHAGDCPASFLQDGFQNLEGFRIWQAPVSTSCFADNRQFYLCPAMT